MSSVHVSRSIKIASQPETVFAAMTDWAWQSDWMLGTSVKAGNKNGVGVGGTIIARTSFGPFGFMDPMTITQWQPPLRCAVLHTGRIVHGSGLFEVEAIDDTSSRFCWSEEIILPFGIFGHLGWLIVKGPFILVLSWSLRRFKHWVE